MNDKLKSVLDKVTKLRALASRAGTQAEAEAAAAQAEALIAKYQIDEATIEMASAVRTEAVQENEPIGIGGRRVTWLEHLIGYLCKDHGCACVICVEDDGVKFRLAGRPSDLAIVNYLISWLRVEIGRLSEQEIGRANRNAFRFGAVHGVIAAMRRAKTAESAAITDAPTASGVAMVLASRHDEAVSYLHAALGGRIRSGGTGGSRGTRGSVDAYQRGQAAGSGLTAKPAMGTATGRPLLGS